MTAEDKSWKGKGSWQICMKIVKKLRDMVLHWNHDERARHPADRGRSCYIRAGAHPELRQLMSPTLHLRTSCMLIGRFYVAVTLAFGKALGRVSTRTRSVELTPVNGQGVDRLPDVRARWGAWEAVRRGPC